MEIGKEAEEPIQAPIPGEQPIKRELPTPIQEPVAPIEEPAHAGYDGVIDGVIVIEDKRYVFEMKSNG